MNCLCAVVLCDFNDAFADEIALARRRRTNVDCFVGFANVWRHSIRVAVNREAFDAELAACANDSYRNLASVGDQDLGKQLTPR